MKKSYCFGIALSSFACVIFTSCMAPKYGGEGSIIYHRSIFRRYNNFYVLYPEFDLREKGSYVYIFKGLSRKDPAIIEISTEKKIGGKAGSFEQYGDIRIKMTLEDDGGNILLDNNCLLKEWTLAVGPWIFHGNKDIDIPFDGKMIPFVSYYLQSPRNPGSTYFEAQPNVLYTLKLEIEPNKDSEYEPLPVRIIISSLYIILL